MYVIYKLILDSGQFYIGVTNNLKRRLYEHKRDKVVVSCIILHEVLSEDEVYALEKFIVNEELLNDPLCMNKTRGGRHPYNMRLGKTHSEETKSKISKTKKENPHLISEEQRKQSSERMKGENNPSKRPEVREKLKIAAKRNNAKRKGLPGTMLGKKLTVEQHSKISYKIKTPEGIFSSSALAAKHFNTSQQTVMNRCNSNKFPEWEVVEKGSKYNV